MACVLGIDRVGLVQNNSEEAFLGRFIGVNSNLYEQDRYHRSDQQ